MTEEPEQIGPLHFTPNPNYPYPFAVPVPPRFWLDEQTGTLAERGGLPARRRPAPRPA